MGADQHLDWAGHTTSVLDWWREAGVDVLVDDTPRDWLLREAAPVVAPAPGVVAEITAPATLLPDTLDAFVAWRTGQDAPEGAGGMLAEGDAGADTMVVVDYPDGDAMIGDAAGRLFDRMLAAIGLARESIYLTTLSTVRPLGGRIAPETLPQLAELLRHHVVLVRPKRLLLLGQAPSRALTGTDATQGSRSLRAINLETGTVYAVTSLHPRFLIEKPAMKAEAWKDLILLMGGQR